MARDLAVDIGASKTSVYLRGRGMLFQEPSLVARDLTSGEIVAVGWEAIERTRAASGPEAALLPLHEGPLGRLQGVEIMLPRVIATAQRRGMSSFGKPRVILCVPSDLSSSEERLLRELALEAGARAVFLLERPVAAAIGAGLPVREPIASAVVDIGAATTELAVIAFGAVAASRSVPLGAEALDHSLAACLKRRHQLLVASYAAEEMKIALGTGRYVDVGSGWSREAGLVFDVTGRDMASGVPRTEAVYGADLTGVVTPWVNALTEVIVELLAETPHRLLMDLCETGIHLTGGGAQLRGLPDVVERATGVPAQVTPDPLHTGVLGAGMCFERLAEFRPFLR